MSRIIRHSTEQLNTKTIKVKSFSFSDELTSETPASSLSVQSLLDEQVKVREGLQQEVQQTRQQLEQQRQELQQEIQAARDSWLQEKEQLIQQAYDEGFTKGYEDGQVKIHEELSQKIAETNETVNSAIKNGQSYLNSQEHVILDLAIESAKRIVGRSLTEDPTAYMDIIKRALVEARDAEFIKVYTSSEYYTEVTNKRNELETLLPPNLLFTVFMDEKLQGSESYLESNHGRMIISMDSQLNELKKSLIEIMESVD
ncbi:MAG: flagellar assembly protein FliH [Kurthia sp.]|nr:flagellar assembly protein FliH [Candidatus Kurthia equi]